MSDARQDQLVARHHCDRGDDLLAAGHLDEAIAEYGEALRADGKYARARHNLGVALYKQGSFERAAVEVREALELAPRNADFHFTLGLIHKDSRQFAAALHSFSTALELDPDHLDARHYRGHTSFEAGDAEAALADFEEVLRRDPQRAHALYDLGIAYSACERWAEAEEALARAAELEPGNADAYYNLGLVHAQDVRTPDAAAEEAFRKAIEINPDHLPARLRLGILYAKAKYRDPSCRDRALEVLEELAEQPHVDRLLPEAHLVHFALGCLYDDRPETYDRAVEEYQRCLRLQPNFAPAHNNLGIISRRRGRPEEAAQQFLRALVADPDYGNAYQNLARLCYDAPHEFLEDLLRRLLDRLPETASTVAFRLVLAFVDVARAEAHRASYHQIHQLKNSLAVHATRMRGLRRDLAEHEPEAAQRLDELLALEERIFSGMQDFLSALHHEELDFQVVNCAELLETAAGQARGQRAEGLEVELRIAPGLPEIRGDPGRLRNMIQNLVNNALEAMCDGGRLTLTAETIEDHATTSGGPNVWGVRLIVADTGVGFPPEQAQILGWPGYTTKPGGSGYGLAIAEQVAHEHRGSIRLEGAPGGGTRATVELPLNLDVARSRARLRLRPILSEDPGKLIQAELEEF